MSSNILPEADVLKFHLNYPAGNAKYFSGFMAGLRDARRVTGRDESTGAAANTNLRGSWLGAVGYMSMLDQIGKCFRPKGKTSGNTNRAICEALKAFTALQDDAILALYALRCSFTHDFCLFNWNANDARLQHHFLVTSGGNQLVTLPVSPWDGNYPANGTSITIIDLGLLGDLVETIYKDICAHVQAGTLDIILPDGSDELLNRYANYKA